MNAVKERRTQSESIRTKAGSAELTPQERRALSLVWREDENDVLNTKAQTEATAHCAVLGYN